MAASATPPTRLFESFEVAGHRFVLLDSNDAAGVGDLTDPQQNAFLREGLARHADQRTFVFFHHPVAQLSTALALPPVIFGVAPGKGQQEFLETVGDSPQVVGVFAGHTHRNLSGTRLSRAVARPSWRTGPPRSTRAASAWCPRTTAAGCRTFQRLRDCAFCRDWIETTRGQFNGL